MRMLMLEEKKALTAVSGSESLLTNINRYNFLNFPCILLQTVEMPVWFWHNISDERWFIFS